MTGLCVWNRDQLGIELERNVWIRTNLKDVNESSNITLIDNTQINGKDSFSENAWREAVSQLGEDYLEIAATIETNHDKMLGHLGKAAEERYERMAIVMKELGFDDDDDEPAPKKMVIVDYTSCNYRKNYFYQFISLIMCSLQSYLSNKPKQHH